MYEKKGDRKNAAEHINKSLDIFRKLNSRKEIEKAQSKIKRIMQNDSNISPNKR